MYDEAPKAIARATYVVVLCLALVNAGCSLSSPVPTDAVRTLLEHLEAGDLDRAARMTIPRGTPEEHRRVLAGVTALIRVRGGVRGVEVVRDETTGDVAEVVARIVYGSGDVATVRYRLLRVKGRWMIDEARDVTEDTLGSETAGAS